jgi:hypothetical protein
MIKFKTNYLLSFLPPPPPHIRFKYCPLHSLHLICRLCGCCHCHCCQRSISLCWFPHSLVISVTLAMYMFCLVEWLEDALMS